MSDERIAALERRVEYLERARLRTLAGTRLVNLHCRSDRYAAAYGLAQEAQGLLYRQLGEVDQRPRFLASIDLIDQLIWWIGASCPDLVGEAETLRAHAGRLALYCREDRIVRNAEFCDFLRRLKDTLQAIIQSALRAQREADAAERGEDASNG